MKISNGLDIGHLLCKSKGGLFLDKHHIPPSSQIRQIYLELFDTPQLTMQVRIQCIWIP